MSSEILDVSRFIEYAWIKLALSQIGPAVFIVSTKPNCARAEFSHLLLEIIDKGLPYPLSLSILFDHKRIYFPNIAHIHTNTADPAENSSVIFNRNPAQLMVFKRLVHLFKRIFHVFVVGAMPMETDIQYFRHLANFVRIGFLQINYAHFWYGPSI